MAAVTARLIAVQFYRGDDDAVGAENANFKVKNYLLSFDNGGTQVAGGTDTLNLDVGAAITGNNHEGKTVTLRAACLAKCFYDAASGTSFAATISISSNTVQLTPVTSNWSSNGTITSSMKGDRPYQIFVTVNEA
jgi:hypothetical protein